MGISITADKLPYYLPYFVSLAISIIVVIITWRRREVIGARLYSFLAFSQSIITFGYILELASPNLAGKIFWDDLQWVGFLLWAIIFPVFSVEIARSSQAALRSIWLWASVIPTIFMLLLITNSGHGLIHHDEWLIEAHPFGILEYEFTPVVWGFAIYGYLIVIISSSFMFASFLRRDAIYRTQVGLIVIGVSIPLAGSMMALLGITLSVQRDITPLLTAVGNLFVTVGLLRYHLFDFVPVAWDLVIQSTKDLVIVVDPAWRIMGRIDAGVSWLKEENREMIGQPLQEFQTPWKDDIKKLQELDEGHLELSAPVEGEPAFFEIELSPLRDRREQLIGRVLIARNVTRQKLMEQELRRLNTDLESLVEERTRELEQAYDSTLEGWAKALELKDKETEGHSRRVTDLTVQLAEKMGCSNLEIENVRRGALLHDIGKMAIPDEILNKPGPLDDSEWAIMKKHTLIAGNLLSHISYLEKALEIPLYHHERWDGKGYPYGLAEDQIPLSARMFTLVDNWDALLSHRPYRPAWRQEKVAAYFKQNAGMIFDPDLVGEFLELVNG